MIKLNDITKHFRHQYQDNNPNHNIIVYPSFNAISTFIRNKYTNTFICLYCYSKNFTNNRFFKIRTLSDKTPVEFLQEAFYDNKIHYLPTKVKSQAVAKLMRHYHFYGVIKNKISGVEIIRAISRVNNDNQIIPSLTQIFHRYDLFFTTLLQHPQKYFKIKNYSQASKKEIKNLKHQIYKLDFKK